MQVSPSSSHFPRGVDLHTLRASYNPYQASFRKHIPATDTRALRDMLPFSCFMGHSTFSLG